MSSQEAVVSKPSTEDDIEPSTERASTGLSLTPRQNDSVHKQEALIDDILDHTFHLPAPMSMSDENTASSSPLPVRYSDDRTQDTPRLTDADKDTILNGAFLFTVLEGVNERFEQYQANPECTSYLPIITKIVEDHHLFEEYSRIRGAKAFLSDGHRDHGDDWLRWKISATLSSGAADQVELYEYWLPLEEKFVWSKPDGTDDQGEFEDGAEN
ncbi:hypothetical protein PSPO01_03523 [Paraphaeosphaeria sporulosa]